MNTWKVVLATMLIFGTGVVTGGLLVRHTQFSRQPNRNPSPLSQKQLQSQLPTPHYARVDFLRRAQRELDLTPSQREQAEKIIAKSQERTRRLLLPVAPEVRNEVQRAKNEFRAILTPSQQEVFDRLVKPKTRESKERRIPTDAGPKL